MRKDLFHVLAKASQETQRVIVGFSGGKDSIATLDLCKRYFHTVYAFNMYYVEDMKLQKNYIKYIENMYDIKILRLPHYDLSILYNSRYRNRNILTDNLPKIHFSDIENYVRDYFKCRWIAYGMMGCESIERMAMIKHCDGVDVEHCKIFPVGFWNDKLVKTYLKNQEIKLPVEYRHSDGSVGDGNFAQCVWVLDYLMKYFPEDYSNLLRIFPFASVKQVREDIIYLNWRKNEERRKLEHGTETM